MSNLLTLFDLVGELARRRYQLAERCFATLGLNHTEARLLTLLANEGGSATQDRLSSLIYLDRSNTGRALNRLEQAGHVERRKDAADKRTNLVQITAHGQSTITEISRIRREMASGFFGGLSEDDAGSIVALLEKVRSHDNQD
jgi:DNA-binding MarR family transcriptional regulator